MASNKNSKKIVDFPSGLKLISRNEFLRKNAEYRLLMRNVPNFIENSPMEIYRWVENIVNLIKSV